MWSFLRYVWRLKKLHIKLKIFIVLNRTKQNLTGLSRVDTIEISKIHYKIIPVIWYLIDIIYHDCSWLWLHHYQYKCGLAALYRRYLLLICSLYACVTVLWCINTTLDMVGGNLEEDMVGGTTLDMVVDSIRRKFFLFDLIYYQPHLIIIPNYTRLSCS